MKTKCIEKFIVIKIFFIVALANLFFGCCKLKNSDCIYQLTVTNNTSKNLRILRSHYFPDTLQIFSGTGVSYFLEPNSSMIINAGAVRCKELDCWEPLFGSNSYGGIASGVLMIGVVDEDTINTIGWETVKENYQILKRYDLTLQDLKDLNWEIIYSE